MSADLRVMSEEAFWNYERNEKDRIHAEYLARQIGPAEMRERFDSLGESISLYVQYRLVLHMRGYVKEIGL